MEQHSLTAQEVRRKLDETKRRNAPFEPKAREALQVGKQYLGADNAHITRIDIEADQWEAAVSADSDGEIFPEGFRTDLQTTYCRRTIETEGQVTLHDAPAQGWDDDPAFETHGLSCYHGTTVHTEKELYGTLCFVADDPREEAFETNETMVVDLIRRFLERELEHQRHQTELTRRINAILENVQDGIFIAEVVDEENFEIQRVNQTFETLTGLSGEEVTNKPLGEILGGDEAAAIRTHFQECVQQRSPIKYDERLPLAGETKYWRTKLTPIIEEGQVTRLVGATRDYTKEKEQEQLYNTIFNSTFQFTGLLETDGTLIKANRSALDFGDLSRDEVLGKKMWEISWFGISEKTQESARQAVERAATGEFVRQEVRVQGADRDAVLDFSVRPVTNDDGEVKYLVPEGRDITERKEREERLKGQQERLEVINRVLRHDIRNAMTVILGRAECLIDTSECKSHAREIKRKGEDIVELSEKARELEDIIGSDLPDVEVVDVAEIVDQTVADLSQKYPDAEFTVERPKGAEATVCDLIDSAIVNVIENAVEHNDKSMPQVEITVTGSTREEDNITVEVADNGPGLPNAEQKVLETGTETALKHSSGLGLWFVYWIVTQSGGSIEFSGTNPQGSLITLRLPSAMKGSDPD